MSALGPRAAAGFGAAVLAAALVLATPLSASAHVHVDPEQAKAGTARVGLTFSVPNEVPSSRTTRVRIALPASAAFTTADPTPIAGWRATVEHQGRTAVAIDYAATGDGIGDGQTQAFVVALGPVPDTGRVLLPVTQTYADGQAVRWSEATPASGDEPEHPAPTLYVRDAPPVDHDTDDDAAEAEQAHPDAAASPSTTADADADQGSSAVAIGVASAALVVALGALVVGLLALLRRRGR